MSTDTLRPASWGEFIGQPKLKHRLEIHIEAAFEQKRALDHVLLCGPPGMGKTSLAELIARKLTDPLLSLTMPLNQRALIGELRNFEGGVLFLDEVHNLSRSDQEMLMPLLADGRITDRRGWQVEIKWLTVVAATTEPDKIIAPLYDRFPVRPDFEPYEAPELSEIVRGMAAKIGIDLSPDVCDAFGVASAGTPRNARQLVFAARDLEALGHHVTAENVLSLCSVDAEGLTAIHNRYLTILDAQGGTAGQKTIEMLLRIPGPIVRNAERLLLERGFVEYTPSGRRVTTKGLAKVRGQTETGGYVRH